MRKAKIQAHRGASGYAPENTLPAFQLAVDMGADGIECDIHYSKDGYFIVCHDETIDRTSTGSGFIKDLTLAEIKAEDFGVKYDEKFKGTTAPTLEEMLDVVKGLDIINIEIKEFGEGRDDGEILDKFYEVLKAYGIVEKTIVSSFNGALLKLLKERHSDMYTCYLYIEMKNAAAYSASLGCNAIHPYFKKLSPATIRSAHMRGMQVNCWTVNEAEDIAYMAARGCDGIITNYPDLAAHREIADAMQQNMYLQREITAARELYNDTVNEWNKDIFAWPTKKIVAAKNGYTTRIPFIASKEIKEQAKGVFF